MTKQLLKNMHVKLCRGQSEKEMRRQTDAIKSSTESDLQNVVSGKCERGIGFNMQC